MLYRCVRCSFSCAETLVVIMTAMTVKTIPCMISLNVCHLLMDVIAIMGLIDLLTVYVIMSQRDLMEEMAVIVTTSIINFATIVELMIVLMSGMAKTVFRAMIAVMAKIFVMGMMIVITRTAHSKIKIGGD